MSLVTPTTKTISDNIIAQLELSLNQTIPLLPKSFLRVLAKVLSGVFILLYKYGGSIFQNMFVQTASGKDTTIFGNVINPLSFWGRLIGVGDPVSATNAELIINITVENQTGSLPSNTQLINSANGVTYITLGVVLLNNPLVLAVIKAVGDQVNGGGAGVIGNLNNGDIVSFVNPIANVNKDTIVVDTLVTGANGESEDAYRQRVLDRFQKRPQGGALSDYEAWGEEVAGIKNVYPYTSDCPGQVDVYVEATPESSGNVDGIPTNAQLQAVLDSIELDLNGLASRRPAGALVSALAITRTGFDCTVQGLVADNIAEVQGQIQTAINEFFSNSEPFIAGLTVPPRLDQLSQSSLIGLVSDIVNASNGTFTTVGFSLTGLGGSIQLYVLQKGEKAKLATPVEFL